MRSALFESTLPPDGLRRVLAPDDVQPLLHVALVLELRAFARAGRSKELVEIELVELPGARNRQQLIRHLVRQQPHLRQRSVGVPLAGVLDGELLLATLFVGVRPVEDLLFNELVLSFANWHDQLTSSPKLKGHAEELLTVSNEHGFPWFSNLALISDGPRVRPGTRRAPNRLSPSGNSFCVARPLD